MEEAAYFIWDVDRILFHIYGPLAIRWYSLMFIIGFFLGYSAFVSFAKKEGKPEIDNLAFVKKGYSVAILDSKINAEAVALITDVTPPDCA